MDKVEDLKNNKILSKRKFFDSEEKGVVAFWDISTKLLSYISILEIIITIWKRIIGYKPNIYNKILYKKENELNNKEKSLKEKMGKLYLFIDIWVSFQVFLPIVLSLLIFNFFTNNHRQSALIISILGLLRVFEIIIKQIRIILFDTLGKNSIIIRSARRSIILLIHNIIEMIFWFSISFMSAFILNDSLGLIDNQTLSELYRWSDFIKCSTLQFTVFGDSYTKVSALISESTILLDITFWEILIGFVSIVISVARFLSLLPSIDDQEKPTM